ncbi:hypothetical protein DRP05_10700, partial [Archaeoglobales archaeon]
MIRINTTTLACIFNYPEMVDRQTLVEYLEENGFKRIGPMKEDLITESGRPVGEIVQEPHIVAHKEDEDIDVIYNNRALLIGFPSSSFITVIGTKFERVMENFEIIYNFLKDKDLISDISLYEATFTGFIESKGISSRIPEFFILEKLE